MAADTTIPLIKTTGISALVSFCGGVNLKSFAGYAPNPPSTFSVFDGRVAWRLGGRFPSPTVDSIHWYQVLYF